MKYIAFILVLLIGKTAFGQLIISERNSKSESFDLYPYTQIVDVGQSAFNLQSFQANAAHFKMQPLVHTNTNIGFTKNYFWLQFRIENKTTLPKVYYLETARPITDFVGLYSEFSNGTKKFQFSGDIIAFDKRDYKHRKTIFKIELPANEKVHFYLNLKSDGEVINLPLKLSTADELIAVTYREQMLFGVFYGILLLATITFLFFFFAVQERSFLYYSLYVGFVALLQFALDGFFYQYFAPNASSFSLKAVLLFAILSTLFFTKYAQWFLNVNSHFKLLTTMYKGIFVMVLILLVICIVSPQIPSLSYTIINALALLSLMLVVITVFIFLYKKVHVDYFFIIGISFMVLGFTIFILTNFNVIPNSFITENSSKLGAGMEVIFLSLSMSNRIKKLKTEKAIAQELALKKSEDMNELKSYFMNNMSHELRTPLNAIMGIAELMLREELDTKIKEDLSIIKHSSESLLSSVNDILDFSKIEKGELKLESIAFDPAKLFTNMNYNVNKQALDKGLLFRCEVDKKLPAALLGDSTKLSQILNNVVGNAIKFTNIGWVNVGINVIDKHDHDMILQISVVDSGIGISAEKIDSIYESFKQETINNMRKYGGLGLGLTIVKKLVDLHGGKIAITSQVGHGTKCVIELPFKIPLEPIAPNIANDMKHLNKYNGFNILLVEDNTVNQLIMKKIMSKWEYVRFSIANHGEEALQLLQKDHFDIVLMDLQMPVMDGYEATTAIRVGSAGVSNINIPIIAITADVMEGTKERAKQVGMDEYMSKPIDQILLFETINRLLAIKQKNF